MQMMHFSTLPLAQTQAFGSLFLDYIAQVPAVRPFYAASPDRQGFAQILERCSVVSYDRPTLVQRIKEQYAALRLSPPSPAIDLLAQPNTYTITTGHQLNLATGHLYFIYKIITTIKLAQSLQQDFPQYNFVPVFWLASEDHDFAEINHFSVFGKTLTWESSQTGAVGRFSTAGLGEVLAQMPELPALLHEAYQQATLSLATRWLVHNLFGAYGLVCIEPDDASLKALMRPLIYDELFQSRTQALIQQSSQSLTALGYKPQVHPREINLFYLAEGLRERIAREGDDFVVLNTDLRFTAAQMRALVDKSPESFSPNVVLRPVYQQMILPNLAYVGGPGELAYWLQLRAMFDVLAREVCPQAIFPVLFPRNFVTLLNKTTAKRWEKFGLDMSALFLSEPSLKAQYLAQFPDSQVYLGIEALAEQAFEGALQQAALTDKSLMGFIQAEKQKLLKSLESVEKRLQKAGEQRRETELNQLRGVRDKVFPNGMLQERYDNFLSFYLNNPHFIQELYEALEPFCFEMYVGREV